MIRSMLPTSPQMLSDVAVLAAAVALGAAALRDVAVRRIANPLVAAVALAGLVRQAVVGAPGMAVVAAACVLMAGAMLWLRGVLGGGDVKLLAACCLLVPAAGVPALLLATALSGGLLAGVHLALRARLAPPSRTVPSAALRRILRCEAWRIRRGAPLPYGVAIAAGTAVAMTRQAG
jgi:prepilin peptidase CpaA